MRRLKVRTDGTTVKTLKQAVFLLAFLFLAVPALFYGSGFPAPPALYRVLRVMSLAGTTLLLTGILTAWLFSRFSPVKRLRVRKKLLLFDRIFLKEKTDGTFRHSVEWQYQVKDGKTKILLYPGGLVKDTAALGKELSQYLREPLLKWKESDWQVSYLFGPLPVRYDGETLLKEGMGTPGNRKPHTSYQPIPIYGDITWDFTSEALHILLIAPSGSGKSRFLLYLGGMVLKRRHLLYVVDAKNSPFGRTFRRAGVPVATNTSEILRLLTTLVQEMEEAYANDSDDDADFSTQRGKGHILIFDEILAALRSAGKQEQAEMERLLGQLALKGRAAGFSLVITAQKLNATDLPKSITEQCQTRIILGGLVSEETFHQATGLYKKDTAGVYRGSVMKGYAVTPKSEGLCYVETPFLPKRETYYVPLLKKLRERGTPYGEGR